MATWGQTFTTLKNAHEAGTLTEQLETYLLERLGLVDFCNEIKANCEENDFHECPIAVIIGNQKEADAKYKCYECGRTRPSVFSSTSWNHATQAIPDGLCNRVCADRFYNRT
jgi:hypothetical protein